MAHTVMKQIFDEKQQKYITCEVLVLDQEENLPGTDRREIILSCNEGGEPYTELSDQTTSDIEDLYPENELIDQYEDFDNRS